MAPVTQSYWFWRLKYPALGLAEFRTRPLLPVRYGLERVVKLFPDGGIIVHGRAVSVLLGTSSFVRVALGLMRSAMSQKGKAREVRPVLCRSPSSALAAAFSPS
jgi:hypothetical protein